MSFASPGSFFDGSHTKDRADELRAVREKKREADEAKAETVSLPVLGVRAQAAGAESGGDGGRRRESGFQPSQTAQRSAELAAERRQRREERRQEDALQMQQDAVHDTRKALADLAKSSAEGFASAVGQFRAMMEICFPDLVALSSQQQIPKSSSLFPVAACLGGDGPCWMHPVPEGDKDGDALLWSKDDHAWLPGEVAGGYNGEFAMSLVEQNGTTKLHVAGGRVYVNEAEYDVYAANFDLSGAVDVYLVITATPNGTKPYSAALATSHGNSAKAWIDIGSCAQEDGVWTITQKYLGGSGLAFGFGLPDGSEDCQVPVWDDEHKKWKPGWVTAKP